MSRRLFRNGRVAMLWPVSDEPFTLKPIAFFFEYGDAVDFVTANLGVRNLYIGEPRYDHRKRASVLDLEAVPLGDGRYQVAA